MEDYYEILGCDRTASYQKLKESYYSLILKHHPDKNAGCSFENNEAYQKIDKAWKTLRDTNLRKTYDSDLKQSEFDKETFIYGTFSLNDLTYDSHQQTYVYPCRCGGQYNFSRDPSDEFNSYLVGCDECSLMIDVNILP